MKNENIVVRRLKLTNFELRVAIDALNAKRLKQKANGIDHSETSDLLRCSLLKTLISAVNIFLCLLHYRDVLNL